MGPISNRFWVGGTATWDNVAGTKWASVSNGAGGASVPTASDNVFFDSHSTGTCTIHDTTSSTCANLDFTGHTGVLDFGFGFIIAFGSVTLATTDTISVGTGSLVFKGTGANTLTSHGKSLPSVTINVGIGSVKFVDSTQAAVVTLTSGTLDTNQVNHTWAGFYSPDTNTRTLTITNSTITITGSTSLDWNTNPVTKLTFNASGSVIRVNGTTGGFDGGPLTYPTVQMGSSVVNSVQRIIAVGTTFTNFSIVTPLGSGYTLWMGTATFGTFTLNAPGVPVTISTSAIGSISFTNLTINGTAGKLVTVNSLTPGSAVTWNVSGTVSLSYISVSDNTSAGVSAPLNAGATSTIGLNTNWLATSAIVKTKTQSSLSRLQLTFPRVQTSRARLAKTFTSTHSSIARLSPTFTFTQFSVARLQRTLTKTQSTRARLLTSGQVINTQTSVSRIKSTVTFTQSAVAKVSPIQKTKSQTATAAIKNFFINVYFAGNPLGPLFSTTMGPSGTLVTGLSDGVAYQARVFATASGLSSQESLPSNVDIPGTVPDPVTVNPIPNANISPTHVIVPFTANGFNGHAITGFLGIAQTMPGNVPTNIVASSNAGQSTMLFVGLSPSTQYVFLIQAVNDLGAGAYSSSATINTTVGAPGPPTNVVASNPTNTTMLVSWTGPTTGRPLVEPFYIVRAFLNGVDTGLSQTVP